MNRAKLTAVLSLLTILSLLWTANYQPALEVEEKAVEPIKAEIIYEDAAEDEKIAEAVEVQMHHIEDAIITAYCPCEICCGEWADGITASGVYAQADHTVAVDPEVIPLGSWVVIGDVWYRAEDTGGAIVGNRIDIFFDRHADAEDFGVHTKNVRWCEGS